MEAETAETAETNEANAREAPRHARDSFDSLRSLGRAHQFVRGQRSRRQGLEAPLKAFERLVELLQEGRDPRDVKDVRQHAEALRSAAGTGERVAATLREALGAGQREIQHLVAASVQGWDKSQIESLRELHELPEEVKQKMQNRDLLRARHAQELRSALQDLSQAGTHPSQYIVQEPADITSRSGLQQVAQLLETRDGDLESALAAACVGVKAYNSRPRAGADADRCEMGARAPPAIGSGADAEDRMSAQASYRTWEQTYLKNGHARASDAAMEDLQTQFADKIAVAGVLGLLDNAGGEGRAVDRLQQALDAAGTAIAQEREHQRKDALSCFPCTALLRAGRQLLEAWRAERDALQHLMQVHRQLEEDLGVCEECLDGSGLQYKEKDAVVQTLRDARKKHENAQLALEALTPWIKGGNQRMIKVVSQEFGLQGEVTLKKLRSDARTTLNDLTIQTLKLTGEIQRHFPEVILFVGQGLPPDLGSLWQPAQSLESFDEKQQVVTE